MDERRELIAAIKRDEEKVSELCRQYSISRKTAYKWLERYEAEGEAGLQDRSRAPLYQPQRMSEEVGRALVELRGEHPRWGPRKLKAYLERRRPEQDWPAASSIGALLSREGLSHPRRQRRRTPARTEPLAHVTAPNQVWAADFKGHFLCGDGRRCDPLTITDGYSRYLLRCRAVAKADGPHVRSVFEAAFREYGLPLAIRTDNGPPFASVAPGGLSRLGMWWIRLGIEHERIAPGCPEQNGRHERMHQTLKAETARPPAANLWRQQAAFVKFQREYNCERPHESLDYRVPAELYIASARLYPGREPEIEYPATMQLRRISQQGSLKWKGERTFLSEVLARETVGLLEIDDELFEVYYGPVLLGWFEASSHAFVENRTPRRGRRTISAAATPSKRRCAAEGSAAADIVRCDSIPRSPDRHEKVLPMCPV